jgi:hypothetical protein
MSEAELHILRARLRGGILNKARRVSVITLIDGNATTIGDGREERECVLGTKG